jgi:hypothetical protein
MKIFYAKPQSRVNLLMEVETYITKYKHSMPCYFVSNGVEIPMTNHTFDFIWNGFGNKDLIDSETSSSEESYKANSSVNKNTNPEWRKQDDGYYNRKPNEILRRENETTLCMRYMRFCHEL